MRNTIIGAAAVAVLGLTAACGDGGNTANENSSETSGHAVQQQHNKADVRFAQQMIPHHEQAVTMADLVPDRSSDEQLRELAKQIKSAQAPEIRKLESMLDTWGEPVEPASKQSESEHDSMSGMMSDKQMRRLKHAEGSEFDTQWVEMMIDHHEGAVEMANTELDNGTNDDAGDLADDIVDAQQDEIAEMKDMLDD